MKSEMTEWLRACLEKGLEEKHYGCACAAMGCGEDVLAEVCVGEAPVPGDGRADAHTRFDMASLSKILGPTMLALKALETGEIRLEEKVRDFFPEAPEDKAEITVQMLMNHTGGFPPDFWLEEECEGPEGAVDAIMAHPLENRPGEKAVYSCIGYILLGKMLEKRMGQGLDILARDRVFQPLGMTETGYCPPASAVCAATEVNRETGRPWIGVVHDENARFLRGVSGNAGVFMPLKDGILFAGMLACMGKGFLKRETMERAIHNDTPGQEAHRGLGFQLAGTPECFFSDAVPDHCFGHTGFTGTSLMVEPESGYYLLLLTNRVYPKRDTPEFFPFRRHLHVEAWRRFGK